jgi:N-methylhydantoinase A
LALDYFGDVVMIMSRRLAVGIDIGGTFTDIWVIDLSTEETWKGKVPSTPNNFSECFVNALEKAGSLAGVGLQEIGFIVHGSTVATNTVVTKQGAKIALITTEGFKDVLQIGTTKRDDIYNLFYKKPAPLVARHHRFEVAERINWDGHELTPLDEKRLKEIIRSIDPSTENISVCYLHSYVNPIHEIRTEEIIQGEKPGMSISCSHKVSPVYREYERLSTTILNGYVMPTTRLYLRSLIESLKRKGLPAEPLLITGDGGATVLDDVLEKPAMTFLSGPSSGVAGAALLGKLLAYDNIISFDMGGTSCDVSLIYKGEPNIRTESAIAGYPSNLPMVDIQTIGAGGGSIAWVDSAGVPHVGPRSAGAEPGPACFGQGGTEPTVTDANLLLGRYNPNYFLGGEKRLDLELAKEAIREKIGLPLRLSEEEAANGILSIVNANMVNAVKLLSIKNGYEPSEFTLMAMGGTACSHLPFLMDELNIAEVICPWMASVFCAFGALSLPIKHNFAVTHKIRDLHKQTDEIVDIFKKLKSQGKERILKDHIHFEKVEIQLFIDARYVGQKYETTIPVFEKELETGNIQAIIDRFHHIHKSKYTYSHTSRDIEIITFRLTAIGTIRPFKLNRIANIAKPSRDPVKGNRKVYFRDGWGDCPIYDGEQLVAGYRVDGPAVIERVDTTIVIPNEKRGIVDNYGNIIIKGRTRA